MVTVILGGGLVSLHGSVHGCMSDILPRLVVIDRWVAACRSVSF